MLGVAVVDPAEEIAALRAELAEARALVVELAGPVVLGDGRIAEVELRRQLCLEAARGDWRAGYQAGYLQAVTDWKVTARDTGWTSAHESYAELDRKRYPPGGRISWLRLNLAAIWHAWTEYDKQEGGA